MRGGGYRKGKTFRLWERDIKVMELNKFQEIIK